nr:hypothetical protein [Tanacetum cinerariifolium]
MVNTRTDAKLAAAVQNALQALLPQIRTGIREEFRTGSGPSGSGRNPPLVTIHTWLERFNKQKPCSFKKATAPVDAENWISHMEKIFNVMGYNGLLWEVGRYNYGIRARFRPVGSKDLTCEDWMVNTRTDADLSAAVQNALQTLLPQIRADIREEFRTSSGPSDAGGNPPPVTIHTWLERFNKQKPHSFEKAIAPVDAENWISHMEKIFDVMGCEDAFKTRLAVYKFEGNALAWWKAYKQAKGGDAWLERLKREYHSIRQTNTETSTEFMQRFLRLAGFLGAAAGNEEEQAKNFQWGLR